MSDLAERIALLPPEKRALLAVRLARSERPHHGQRRVPVLKRGVPAPLSHNQRSMWFLDQLYPGNAAYNSAVAVRFSGRLDLNALEWSLNEVVRRHDLLRTVFDVRGGDPLQYAKPFHPVALGKIELGHLPESERMEAAREEAVREAQQPFDLANGSVWRAKLLCCSEREHLLVIILHHIICDAWSIGILVRELAASYEASLKGETSPLPELPIQYADYAVWQREQLAGPSFQRHLELWRKRLQGARDVLEIPLDKPRPAERTFRGARLSSRLSPQLSESLRRVARLEGATLFMVLLGAFKVLLARYSGESDVVVGSQMANRECSEVEGLIGFFANTLALRTDLSGDPAFIELLARVRETALGAYDAQDVPFGRLVEELKPEKQANRNPVFDIDFNFRNVPLATFNVPDFDVGLLRIDNGTSKFDLSMEFAEVGSGLEVTIEYSTELFHASTPARLLKNYQTLLEGIVADPKTKISRLPLLTEAERNQILVEWNRTTAEPASERCVHELFEDQVKRTPRAIAVLCGDQQLSYQELNNQANRLAHHLIGRGVKSESFVGIMLDRSMEMIVAILATLKAGAAYLPLDPEYPQARLAEILTDAMPKVVLTNARLRTRLPETVEALALDTREAEIMLGLAPVENPIDSEHTNLSAHAAYLIYTSGSTGTPKGVVIEHAALATYSQTVAAHYELSSADRVLQFSSLSFDAAVEEIFPTLSVGASLVMRRHDIWTTWECQQQTRELGITVLNLPTAYWEQLVQDWANEEDKASTNVRLIVVGGEAMRPQGVAWWQRTPLRRSRLLNTYGPTEATVVATTFEVPPTAYLAVRVPVGRPLPGRLAYVLDGNLEPVPVGVPGDLYLGGTCLARGYLNQRELTAERFVADPHRPEPEARMYQTGDRARWLPDGNIEFIDRSDRQIKFRGFRIELGEVEVALRRHPKVRDAVVIAREDESTERQLVAYIVPCKESAPADLRSFLEGNLPSYMIPQAFVELDALPMTTSGKLDRKALPKPQRPLEGYRAPRTPEEEILCAIYAELLSLEQVGIHDDFFSLGGHSLLAMRLVSRVRSIFGVELALHAVFEAPTVAELSGRLPGDSVALTREKRRGERHPLSYTQRSVWFLDQLYPGTAAYNSPIAVRFVGRLNPRALEWSLNEVVRRHDLLRTVFESRGGDPVQYAKPFRPGKLRRMDLGHLAESERMEAAREEAVREAQQPFDLASGQPWRAKLLCCSEREHVLVLVLHHIICDGWSVGVLVRELVAGYEAFLRGESAPLPDLQLQYADYVAWQREQLAGPGFQRHLELWRKRLEGAPDVLQLPLDRPRPAETSFHGARIFAPFSPQLTESLRRIALSQGVTLFMVLLGAFKVLLSRYSRESDIIVGSPIANRERREFEGLIGFFANTLALRTDLSGDPTFVELLARVRETTLSAYDSQEVPFEKLVEELRPERRLNRNPFFDIGFSFQNLPMPAVNLPDLSIDLLRVDNGTSKFDLSVVMVETERGLATTIEYSTQLFDGSTANRLLGNYRTLLEAIAEDPRRKISRFPLLTPSERNQVIFEWNDTDRDFPRERCIHELFEAQVERTPEAISVVFEDQQLSYRELNSRANQLAHYLKKSGVGPEVLVGICVERSIGMIVAILGVLKAGGAYVPLDPNYPPARLAFMLTDANVSLLIAQERTASRVDEPLASVILLDRDWHLIARERAGPSSRATRPENLAYVVYTSGSTGRPKGVAIEHRQLLNYLQGIQERLKLPRNASFATVSTIAADLGNTVVFGSLCGGGTLHVISEERSADADALGDYFSRHAIDCLKIVPSHLAALQNGPRPTQVLPRKLLILGGETSRLDWIKSLLSLNPGCAVMNHYGPTEATVGVLTYRVETEAALAGLTNLPLGRPIFNTKIYLLDQHLNPVPVGVAGELHIGGLCLARGYLNHPDLTAERFIPSPFSNEAGARLYRSGDLARYLPDGNIEFLGRVDDQVKIRGFRIEPREIEAALEQHPGIMQVAVIAAQDQFGGNRLVAYLVPKREPALMISAQRRYVLPNGMAISHLNRNETDYLYDEIFERRAYLRHGITLKDGDCIFDVGANIGLFMLFALQSCKRPKIYAFEPNPAVYDILKVNASLYAPDARIFPCGLSNESKTATFTFFPGFSLLSGFYGDSSTEKQLVKTYLANQQKAGAFELADVIAQSDDLLDLRFSSRTFTAPLRTLSEIIEEEGIESVDLLKINVEKSELDVLRGITEADWAKIKQIVVEADTRENLRAISLLLEEHGYELAIDQDVLLKNTELCYVYATRRSSGRRLLREQGEVAPVQSLSDPVEMSLSTPSLRSFLQKRLPDYMVPSDFVVLKELPRNANGKLDRSALPTPERGIDSYRSPGTPEQEILSQIFADLLEVERVGIADSFFELGGHSLLAMQLVSRIRSTFGVEISMRVVFEAPTVAELVERLFRADRASAPLGRMERPERLPLSFAQQRLWFLCQLGSSGAEYNMRETLRLRGELDVNALERAVNALVERHEILRTRFDEHEGEPYQIVEPVLRIPLPVDDLSGLQERQCQEAIDLILRREAEEGFNLREGPLLRIGLLKLGPQDHVFFWTCHHIIADGWSIALFHRELRLAYAAFCAGEENPFERLAVQYADYAIWQRGWMQGEELERLLGYWQERLAGAQTLELPTDRPRPPRPSYSGGSCGFTLGPELTARLVEFDRREKVTPFMSLLAAFQVLLYRYSGQEDYMVGTPVANRGNVEVEGLIGPFVNTLAMRADLTNESCYRELVSRVKRTGLDAYQYQDLPFEELVEDLNPERDTSRHPLFQVMFALQNAPDEVLALQGLEVSRSELACSSTRFDLELHLWAQGDSWKGSLVYSRDLFEEATIEGMVHHYLALLKGMLEEPDRAVSLVPMMSEAERNRLVVEWNATKVEYPKDRCIHHLFTEQARRNPQAVAVVFRGRELSYGELDERSSQLARYLSSLGVGAGARVAICIEPSVEMIVGLLGILKAGGAYVPIDPEYPAERISLMLAESEAAVVLTRTGLLARFSGERVRSVCLDENWERVEKAGGSCAVDSAKAEDLAYLLFTSGSTGRPKGVCVPHRAVNRLVVNCDYIQLGAEDVVAQTSNCCFDAAIFEIWGALLNGSRLVGIEREQFLSVESFSAELARHRVTTLFVTTALFNELVHERPGIFASIRTVLFGGEECDAGAVRRVLQSAPPQRLLHMYGPTETTTFATWYEIKGTAENYLWRVPIGRPISNTQVYILDENLEAVPIGVAGEIWIGGEGVSHGYLQDPELTAERFIASPFVRGTRLYRTGDRGRFRADGNIEFLGRIDQQVKIRGFRIEPGEIESVLLSYPGVRQAAVCARETSGASNEKRLVGYVVMEQGGSAAQIQQELRAFLKSKLPEYMLPAALVLLDKLPLTPTGKIDRSALPAPELDHQRIDSLRSRKGTEKMVAEAWSEVIDCENIGVYENFFQLGGHSLLAMRVVSRLRTDSGVDIPLRVFFENATVAGLAEYIEDARLTLTRTAPPPFVADREELVL